VSLKGVAAPSVLLCAAVFLLFGCGTSRGGGQSPGDAGSACDPKGAGCSCPPGAQCTQDSVCFATQCEERSEWPLQLETRARACDVLIKLPSSGRFLDVSWSEHVMGHAETRGQRVGVSFISDQDADLSEVPLRLLTTGKAPKIEFVSCANRDGQPLDESTISIQP
jgi:hypothetical protein